MNLPLRTSALYQGYIDEWSEGHLAGWVRNLESPSERVALELVRSDTGEVLERSLADHFFDGLVRIGIGDGRHWFYFDLPAELPSAAFASLVVRVAATGRPLEVSPHVRRAWEPVQFVAMDIVNNCNLRCPFCLYDYAHTNRTHFMTAETLEAALRLLPYTSDGNFWFSCLHEPTLHPKLTDFIAKVPEKYRRKLFYTSNLAKRMPDSYYAFLGDSGMHHLNISIESREPALYERMRKGARFRIFQESWSKMLAAMKAGRNPPDLYYIAMAYKSNLRELPEMVRYLRDEGLGRRIELRHTFNVDHVDPEFKRREFLDRAEWDWLEQQLSGYPAGEVLVWRAADAPEPGELYEPAARPSAPPDEDHFIDPTGRNTPPAPVVFHDDTELNPPSDYVPGKLQFHMTSAGDFRGYRILQSDGGAREDLLADGNIANVADPAMFLRRLFKTGRNGRT
jgi:molybdenum cofactor biosynthesis enzyme MoaA